VIQISEGDTNSGESKQRKSLNLAFSFRYLLCLIINKLLINVQLFFYYLAEVWCKWTFDRCPPIAVSIAGAETENVPFPVMGSEGVTPGKFSKFGPRVFLFKARFFTTQYAIPQCTIPPHL